jgi:hypothetical protein
MSKSNKWDELNGVGRGDMVKRRSAQAVGAWSRHQGAHSPGTKRPDLDDIDEQEQDALEDELEQMTNSIEASLRSLIEELEEDLDDEEE